MLSLFQGGPHDGRLFGSDFLSKVGVVTPIWTPYRVRTFLLMPYEEDCNRILRGEARVHSKPSTTQQVERVKSYAVYEREILPGRVEYHHDSTDTRWNGATKGQSCLGGSSKARRTFFGNLAAQFIREVRQSEIMPATDVFIRCHGQMRNALRWPITYTAELAGLTTVRHEGGDEDVREVLPFAVAMHRESIIAGINRVVRDAPTVWIEKPEIDDGEFKLWAFELVIEQP